MKAKISVSGTRYRTISASITFSQSGRSLFGSSSFNSGNRKRMIIKSILKMHRVKKKDVKRWEKMTLDEIYDDITPLIIASELSS